MQQIPNDFDAPAILADRCGAFAGDPDEPGICLDCGWLRDEHQDLEHAEPVAA